MLTAVLLWLAAGPVLAAAPAEIWVEPSSANGLPARIDLFPARTGGSNQNPVYTYQLYLPGNADASECFLSWEGEARATVNGVSYASGLCPAPPVDSPAAYAFQSEGESETTLQLIAYQGSPAVPAVFIQIDESEGKPTIAQMDGDPQHNVTCSGSIHIGGQWYEMKKIKGRGNVTWDLAKDKRPYNITLKDKISFPGVDSQPSKKWSFLAEILDHSLLCNRSGFWLAHQLGVGQDTASADVWMNGEYQGCYTVTPKTDSFVTKNGFMIEQDNYLEPAVADGGDPQFRLEGLNDASPVWTSGYNRITVKSIGDNLLKIDGAVIDTPENMEAVALNTIRPWLQEAWDAIRSDSGRNAQGKHYSEYIDVESFAKMYLLQEYVKSYDVCAGSILFHRDGNTAGDKLIAGPLWDLDNAMGSTYQNSSLGRADDRRNGDRRSGEGAFIANITEYKTSIYKTLSRQEGFMDEVYRQYNLHRAAFDRLQQDTAGMAEDIAASARMDHIKVQDITLPYGWGDAHNNHRYASATTLGTEPYRQDYLATTDAQNDWGNYAANLQTYIRARSLWFKNTYARPLGGNCGAEGVNLTWTLDEDGVLTIRGAGNMADYAEGGAPWYAYRHSITAAVIENGVTGIGDYAFAGCDALRDVYYNGSAEDWQDIAIGSNNAELLNANMHYNTGGYTLTLDDRTNGAAAVTGVSGGGQYAGETSFTVSCVEACAVVCSTDGGQTYTRLTATAVAGGYRFTINMTADTTIVIVKKGDANLNGSVANQDATITKAANLQKRSLTPLEQVGADVNGSGSVNNQDVTKLKAALLQKTTLDWDVLE